MAELKDMYHLLEQMVREAENHEKDKVMSLEREFEELVPSVFHEQPTELECRYDRCRQSCKMAFAQPDMYEKLISHAKTEFEKIPSPD